MTDNDIIKALDGADVFLRNRANSEPAQLNEYDIEAFIDIANVCDEAANLINRQKSEIERLETNCLSMAQTMPNMAKAERAEAKKEFAEELIYKIVNTPTKFESTYYMYREGIAFRQNEIIDIIKEMVGEIDV